MMLALAGSEWGVTRNVSIQGVRRADSSGCGLRERPAPPGRRWEWEERTRSKA